MHMEGDNNAATLNFDGGNLDLKRRLMTIMDVPAGEEIGDDDVEAAVQNLVFMKSAEAFSEKLESLEAQLPVLQKALESKEK